MVHGRFFQVETVCSVLSVGYFALSFAGGGDANSGKKKEEMGIVPKFGQPTLSIK